MAKNRNTFAKQQRETEKKRKAKDKRSRRQERKDAPAEVPRTTAEPQDSDLN
jgi:hypothetical protein